MRNLCLAIENYFQQMRQRRFSHNLCHFLYALLALFVLYQLWLLASVMFYSVFNPSSSAMMREQAYALERLQPNRPINFQWIDYADMGQSIKKAAIASEDANFAHHGGVEWDAVYQAWKYNNRQERSGRHKVRGGSTISQQLAKNLFLSKERSYWRKAQELVLTYEIEFFMSKERILELYLNLAQFGEDVFGIQAASWHYFSKAPQALTRAEAARLIVLLPNPKVFGKNIHSHYMNQRTQTVLQRMGAAGLP